MHCFLSIMRTTVWYFEPYCTFPLWERQFGILNLTVHSLYENDSLVFWTLLYIPFMRTTVWYFEPYCTFPLWERQFGILNLIVHSLISTMYPLFIHHMLFTRLLPCSSTLLVVNLFKQKCVWFVYHMIHTCLSRKA